VWFSVFNHISDLQPAVPLPPPSSPWFTLPQKGVFTTRMSPPNNYHIGGRIPPILTKAPTKSSWEKEATWSHKADIKSQLPTPNAKSNSTSKTWILPSNPTMGALMTLLYRFVTSLVSVVAVFAEIFHANPGTSCIDFWCVGCLMMFNLPQLSDTSSTIEYNLCSCIDATMIRHHRGSCSLRYWMVPAKFHGSRFSLWYYFLFEQSQPFLYNALWSTQQRNVSEDDDKVWKHIFTIQFILLYYHCGEGSLCCRLSFFWWNKHE
jgi:hypothetical protein